jgi:hypothetical protein
MKISTNARNKVEALQRRKALLDALIVFVKKHPEVAGEAVLQDFPGKTSLKFPEYALLLPRWKDGKAVLRLVKSGGDWINNLGFDAYLAMERLVKEDVMGISEQNLNGILDRLYREANPDDDE